MYYRDHNPPHFHAVYGDFEGLIAIQTLEIISGKLPPRVLGIVVEWATLYQNELLDNWERAKRHERLQAIQPLI